MYHQKNQQKHFVFLGWFLHFSFLAAAILDQFLVQLQLCQPANKSHKLVQIEKPNLALARQEGDELNINFLLFV